MFIVSFAFLTIICFVFFNNLFCFFNNLFCFLMIGFVFKRDLSFSQLKLQVGAVVLNFAGKEM